MLSHILSFFNFFGKKSETEDDAKEDFLAEQLVELEIAEDKNVKNINTYNNAAQVPSDTVCFQRTGKITYMDEDHVLIDGILFYNTSRCTLKFQINDKVSYLGYKDANESIIIVRILQNYGNYWGNDEDLVEETSYDVINHVMVGEVDNREERYVFIKDSDLKFDLDSVEGSFVPIKGDWIEMQCSVQYDENKPIDVKTSQVLKVISFKPLRKVIKSATVTEWFGHYGSCNRQIYFDKNSLETGSNVTLEQKVMVEAIESNQGEYTWRALKLILVNNKGSTLQMRDQNDEEQQSLDLEKENNIELTYPIKFDNVNIKQTEEIEVILTNKSGQNIVIKKWTVLGTKRNSQIKVRPEITKPIKLPSDQSFVLTIKCTPKFLGYSKERIVISCHGFQLKRYVEMRITDRNMLLHKETSNNTMMTEREKKEILRNVRRDQNSCIPGVKLVRPANFVAVRLGVYAIPRKLWSIMLGEMEDNLCFNEKMDYITTSIPILMQDLNRSNYAEKLHTLLYLEEIQLNINMRLYDKPQAFLLNYREYLGIEIYGLSERRPSLMKGDRVMVRDAWAQNAQKYEGFIHDIKGDLILMKFSPNFHSVYSGSDVSIEFHFNRSVFRKAHHAIDQALVTLGCDMLFPRKLLSRPPRLPPAAVKSLTWFNDNLNTEQKSAVINILKGESRPLPYCIFGPPGTGKTVTVVETILQILTVFPDSRILVATPSNSAANLITERLLEYRQAFSDSIIRLIANYLADSTNFPDIIKPFCATLDIARDDTSSSKHTVTNGMNMHCQASYVGRHRVTIGTCYCLGTLALMGLPRGHFTHIIIDEAAQATEPEVLIPMNFVDKEDGQVILAGDPMQLGPVIVSKYCNELGLDESYMSRLLLTYPYHKDYYAFEGGYNSKLITKLNDNYRSLEEVLCVPSDIFYDGSLVPKLDRTQPWVENTMRIVSEVFGSLETDSGGIYVYGIQGCNEKSKDSPSWFNPEEASMVALKTCKLYKKGLTADDLGIITPYIAQTLYIKTLFDAMGLPQPKIGTVEEFQGQERSVILLSTVRSSKMWLMDDQTFSLGFVQNPKRLNVAITRAQVALILFCNPHLLSTDVLWRAVIDYAVRNDNYRGCNLPQSYTDERVCA